ncbi:MAG: hypothetical protein KatS3mg015_3211 [Fimbriimonadales bacterium]|nr:MAG: hypothetical protein KatS3mg015_3211 [Fimbriimonadales bacterium]
MPKPSKPPFGLFATAVLLCASASFACPGDCNRSGTVTAADITRMVALILLCDGEPAGCAALPRPCATGDVNGSGRIDVGDLLQVIDQVLRYPLGCPPMPAPAASHTPTHTPTHTTAATATPTATASGTPTDTPEPTPTPLPPSATPKSSPSASPTPTLLPAVCGNGVVEPAETCDDGNLVTNPPADSCPEDCTILTCTPSGTRAEVAVNFSSPRGLTSIAVLVEYPDGAVQIPGTGDDASVATRVTNRPSGFLASIFDFDYALRVALAGTRNISGTQLFRIQFDVCHTVAAPPASAYRCRVVEANDANLQPVSGVTCTVTTP